MEHVNKNKRQTMEFLRLLIHGRRPTSFTDSSDYNGVFFFFLFNVKTVAAAAAATAAACALAAIIAAQHFRVG